MADLNARVKKEDSKPQFEQRKQGRTLYKDKKPGDQIVLSAILDKWWHLQQMLYPVLGQNRETNEVTQTVNFLRANGKYWNHNAKGSKTDREKDFIKGGSDKRPLAEANFVMLANLTLGRFREFAKELWIKNGKSEKDAEDMALAKIMLSLGSGPATRKFWNKGSEEWGTLAAINGEIYAFPAKSVTYNPLAGARSGNTYWKENLKPEQKVAVLLEAEFTPADFAEKHDGVKTAEKLEKLLLLNRGIKQFNEELITGGDGKRYFRFPPFITEFILTAEKPKKQFNEFHLNWRPTAVLHEDYQEFLSEEYSGALALHPDDVDIVRAYLTLPSAKRAATPPPAYREHPSEAGLLVYISMDNPFLPPTKAINVLDGPLAERFTPELLKKIAEYGEYHGFRPNTQQGLLGSEFYDYPTYEYEITSEIAGKPFTAKGKTGSRRIYLDGAVDFTIKDSVPTVEVDGHDAPLEYSEGILHAKPIDLDGDYLMRILMEKGLIKTSNTAKIGEEIEKVMVELRGKARELGIPVVGDEKAAPYPAYQKHKDYAALVSYYESKRNRTSKQEDAGDSDEVPEVMERGKDIGL